MVEPELLKALDLVASEVAGGVGAVCRDAAKRVRRDAERIRELESQLENILDERSEGAWMARALDAERALTAEREEHANAVERAEEKESALHDAEETITRWKDCSGLIGKQGDPDSVTPGQAKAYWVAVESERDRLLKLFDDAGQGETCRQFHAELGKAIDG